MVKGVNKTVIEVNNTGSKLFEKIVFYVTPEYSTLSAKQLRKAANNFSFNYEMPKKKDSFRKKYRKKCFYKFLAILFGVIAVLTAAILIIL